MSVCEQDDSVKLVVDASVAAKWLVPEALSDAAVGLLNPDNELVVPDLFWAEVGNTLWKKAAPGSFRTPRP
jgi:predicted nucleic acid-binding protein